MRDTLARSIVVVAVGAGCTTLGPMPATTLVSPVPAGDPGVELGLGAAPGTFLSSGATEDPKGASMPQASLLFEPDRLLHIPGLFVGVRAVGPEDAGPFGEPMLGYRRTLGDRFSLGIVGYGTRASGDNNGASYDATRLGVEVSADVRVTPVNRWAELHVAGGLAATGLLVDGSYCLDSENKYGVDCPEEGDPGSNMVDASASGLYPSGYLAAVLAFGQHTGSYFHGGRLMLQAAAGTMPTVIGGVQEDAAVYAALGLSLSLGFGARSEAP